MGLLALLLGIPQLIATVLHDVVAGTAEFLHQIAVSIWDLLPF